MEIIIQPDFEAVSRCAARIIASRIRKNPAAVLGLATGSTPLPLYGELIRLHREESLSFARVTTFNLDEYTGLSPRHPASYHSFMRKHLFDHIDIDPARTHLPDGLAQDVPGHCIDYEHRIAVAGGIDIQILGLGRDGHIGFNEPSSSLASRTRQKTLTEQTRADNARFFSDFGEVPHHVLTMGVGTIMDARTVLLLASGESKAAAIGATVEGPVTASVPASALQFHPDARILIDEPAASRLQRADYYRHVFAHKPAWQN